MDIIQDRGAAPDMPGIENHISGDARLRWRDLTAHIEAEYKSAPQIVFSVCAGKPGWNVKYKKGAKALCTLYPETDGFTALVVLGTADMMRFDAVRPAYTAYINALYDKCRLFNNTKWLMIQVSDDDIQSDVKKLLHLKLEKR